MTLQAKDRAYVRINVRLNELVDRRYLDVIPVRESASPSSRSFPDAT
jgi:hypothetical protein